MVEMVGWRLENTCSYNTLTFTGRFRTRWTCIRLYSSHSVQPCKIKRPQGTWSLYHPTISPFKFKENYPPATSNTEGPAMRPGVSPPSFQEDHKVPDFKWMFISPIPTNPLALEK